MRHVCIGQTLAMGGVEIIWTFHWCTQNPHTYKKCRYAAVMATKLTYWLSARKEVDQEKLISTIWLWCQHTKATMPKSATVNHLGSANTVE